jgi:hypothetical protein
VLCLADAGPVFVYGPGQPMMAVPGNRIGRAAAVIEHTDRLLEWPLGEPAYEEVIARSLARYLEYLTDA